MTSPDAAKDAAAAVVKEAITTSANAYYFWTRSDSYCDESGLFNYFANTGCSGKSGREAFRDAWFDGSKGIAAAPYRIGERISNASFEFAETGDDTNLVNATSDLVGPVAMGFIMGAAIRPAGVGPTNSGSNTQLAGSNSSVNMAAGSPLDDFTYLQPEFSAGQAQAVMREFASSAQFATQPLGAVGGWRLSNMSLGRNHRLLPMKMAFCSVGEKQRWLRKASFLAGSEIWTEPMLPRVDRL